MKTHDSLDHNFAEKIWFYVYILCIFNFYFDILNTQNSHTPTLFLIRISEKMMQVLSIYWFNYFWELVVRKKAPSRNTCNKKGSPGNDC
jgi:hypothetical protein